MLVDSKRVPLIEDKLKKVSIVAGKLQATMEYYQTSEKQFRNISFVGISTDFI